MKHSMDHHHDQAGYALIEVIVSAAVLALLALAVLSGMDGATLSTAREKARAMAGTLAEQDQERMRSYRFDALAVIPQATPTTIDGVTYTTKSEATWVTDDANGTPACGTSAQKQAEYLRIATTVTSNLVGKRIAPVKIESLVAPSVVYGQDHGTLAVRVLDRAGVGVPGILVSATAADGTALTPATTNASGCALFRSIEVGGYTIRLNTVGYISKAGTQALETTTTVNPNYINNVSMTYDRKINMTVSVKTLEPGDTFSPTASTAVASKALMVSDGAADPTVLRTFTPVGGGYASTFSSPDLFPYYNSPYSYFTGDCAYMSPTRAANVTPAPYSTYFSTVNALAAVQGDPNALQPQAATVFQPPLNVRLLLGNNDNTLATTSATIKVFAKLIKPSTQSSDTCVSAYSTYQALALKDWPAAYGGLPSGASAALNFVSQAGAAFDAGLPFGTYNLCFQDGTKYYTYPNYNNTTPGGLTNTLKLSPAKATWVTTGCA